MASSSRFFYRPGDSSSDDEADADDGSMDRTINAEPETRLELLEKVHTLNSHNTWTPTHPADGDDPIFDVIEPNEFDMAPTSKDFLIHSLLEERAIRQAMQELEERDRQTYRQDHPAVKQLANSKYRFMVSELQKVDDLDLADVDRQDPLHKRVMQDVAGGLQKLDSIASSAVRSAIEDTNSAALELRKSFANLNTGETILHHSRFLELDHSSSRISRLPEALRPLIDHPMLDSSRYIREFDQVSLLGKGGFGAVYKVRHRLDQAEYAVKRLILQQIETTEIDVLFKESRALAKLDHPNIVRYHASWLEIVTEVSPNVKMIEALPGMNESDEDVSTASEVVAPADDMPPFTTTRFRRQSVVTVGSEEEEENDSTEDEEDDSEDDEVYNHHIATIPRPVDRLVLHIQMSLHPGSLFDFIQTPSMGDKPQACDGLPTYHCFHLIPTLAIFEKIVDAVEYLHKCGIAHHDLKPGNIFLSFPEEMSPGCIDLSACPDCSKQGIRTPACMNIRVGDFGLVKDMMGPCDKSGLVSKPSGTIFYRPPTTGKILESVDVYSLGVILTELLHKFGSGSERICELERLKAGELDKLSKDFLAGAGVWAPNIQNYIARMTANDETVRPTCSEVKKMVADLRRHCKSTYKPA